MQVDKDLVRRLKQRKRTGKRRNLRKLTDAQIQDALVRYADGEGYTSLARSLQVNESAIRYWVRKAIEG